jgi:hypothetical protein
MPFNYLAARYVVPATVWVGLATIGYGIQAPEHSIVTSLTFKETNIVGGLVMPAHLDINFAGEPGQIARLRPEKNDATGWLTKEPMKGDFSFNKRDATGPYLDVPLTGASPQRIAIDTVRPETDRENTFVTASIANASPVESSRITIESEQQ